MKILVSEFITGGGLIGESLTTSLLQEGRLMLDAIVSDLGEINSVEVFITLDPRCAMREIPRNCRSYIIKENYFKSLSDFCHNVDAVLLIAPESDGCLEQISQLVIDAGKLLLGSSPDVIKLTASKLLTAKFFVDKGISVVKTTLFDDSNIKAFTQENNQAWIVKPDGGVGCKDISICYSINEIKDAAANCHQAIVQPKIEGIPASISLLCYQGECLAIGYNEQLIKCVENKLSLVGLRINALLHFQEQLGLLAKQVCAALPELKGYVGLDVIISEDDIVLIEVNPRMTTSYVGLKESINTNPAKLLLDMLFENTLPILDSSEFKMITVNI